MNKLLNKIFPFLLVSILLLPACASTVDKIEANGWLIEYNKSSKMLNYSFNGKSILKDVYAKVKVNGDTLTSSMFSNARISNVSVSDIFGEGQKYTVTYEDPLYPTLQQVFYFYADKDYFLTELFVHSLDDVKSNYLAPICSDASNSFLQSDSTNRALRVPFDNDAFVHYLSLPLTSESVSFEVTSFFNGKDRNGLVLGSVEHDVWKTGIKYSGTENQYVTKLECYGGITHELTRDISEKEDRPSCEHGSIKGKSLKSPKIFFGFFDDWRRGLEKYGDANAIVAPPRQWEKGTPFGWNSWAAMATKVNYEGSIDVSDFIKKELQSDDFENDNTVYIGLDSFWDNFTPEQLKQFVDHCKENGQEAGIYWCPFSDWHGNSEAFVEGTSNEYKYKDIYLYANGKPRKIESLAVDPTHPATKKRIDHYIGMFKELGYTYIKLDFINNGTLEADSFYNPDVTTGVQAYNEGMKYLSDACGDMFMALSIAPTFPSQYGTSKRISCDTWGAMTEGDWGTTGYMLNSLSFAWWLDRVYPFNDADHILLHKVEERKDYKEGANRARITSAVITGTYMLGDNFSSKGSLLGDPMARERAKLVTGNKDINDIARIGKSFYPIEGYTASAPQRAENCYMYETDKEVYVAIFNFNAEKEKTGALGLSRLGLEQAKVKSVKELWSGTQGEIKEGKLLFSIPMQDVRVYRIEKDL